MQKFITYYIESASLQSITSFDMQRLFAQFIEDNFEDPDEVNELLGDISWNEWKYEAGSDPSGTLNFETTNSKKAQQLALDYIALGGNSSPANYIQYNAWYSNLKVVFLQTLQMAGNATTLAVVTKIDSNLNITGSTDPEVQFRWFSICLYLSYQAVYTPALNFVST